MTNDRAFVVMVDDDNSDAFVIRKAFERGKVAVDFRYISRGREFFDYLDGASGKTADPLDRLPDVILLDINMPEMDGFQVLRKLRDDPKIRHLPVTMLSTSSQHEDIVKAYQVGANSYVVKPSSVAELQDFVENFDAFWFKLSRLPGPESRSPVH